MPCDFLDKELQQVVRDAELGRRLVDKLVRVVRKPRQETWVLIQVEVQGQPEQFFDKQKIDLSFVGVTME